MASIRDHVDIIIRLIFGFAIAIGCYYIVSPFLTAIVIAAIITIVSWPMFARCKNSFAEYSTPAAFVMVGLLVVCLIIPLSFLSAVIAQQLPGVMQHAGHQLSTGNKRGRPESGNLSQAPK